MSSPPNVISVTIAANPPPRLDKALARDVPEGLGLSRSRLAALIRDGAVMRAGDSGGQVVDDLRARVAEGEVFHITLPAPRESHILPEAMPLDIVYEDADLVVVNKPAGLVVHPAPGSPSGTLVNGLMAHFGDDLSGVGGVARPGIVHRIDKDTSGLLVVARTDAAHQALAAQFAAHTVTRHYQAVVHGVPDRADPRLKGVRGVSFEPGNVVRITTRLSRHKTDRQRQAVRFDGGRHAVTRLRLERVFGSPGQAALVTCWLETGRTHQIRVHMAHIGHGLIGDRIYGGRRKLSARALGAAAVEAARGFPRQALHAATLGFTHPSSGERLSFDAPLPADMAGLLGALGETE